MKITFIIALLAVTPVLAQQAPKSEVATEFLERCLADVTANQISKLKQQAPEYAASLPQEELEAGGMAKAQKACPCFLQIIAIDPGTAGDTPEAKVSLIVGHLNNPDTGDAKPFTAVLTRMTRLCGERNTILPPSWIGR